MNYTQQKLWEAVSTLVTRPERIQERLGSAAQFLLPIHHIRPEERAFAGHPELQRRFDIVMERLTNTPARADEGRLEATTRALSDADAGKIAEEIFSLFCTATDLADSPVGFEPRPRTKKGA